MRVNVFAPATLLGPARAHVRAAGHTAAKVAPFTEAWFYCLPGRAPCAAALAPMKFFVITNTVPFEVRAMPHLSPDRLPESRDLLAPAARAADTAKELESVAARLRAGQSYADLDAEVDRLLGTEMEARDSDVEGDWELTQAERRGEVIDP